MMVDLLKFLYDGLHHRQIKKFENEFDQMFEFRVSFILPRMNQREKLQLSSHIYGTRL